jgi:hypothetical protein
MRRTVAALTVATLGLLASGCGQDDGADVRNIGGTGSGGTGSGSVTSGSGSVASGSGSGSIPEAAGEVPEGVAAQYAAVEAEIAAEGGATESGDWRVGYIVEPAEPWFEDVGTFREPAAGETHHIEIVPFEAATGRIVPDVPIRLEVVDDSGAVVDEQELSFYYAEFFHYANNFSVPEQGTYTLRATLSAPSFRRHGEESEGPALAQETTVEFSDVQLSPDE